MGTCYIYKFVNPVMPAPLFVVLLERLLNRLNRLRNAALGYQLMYGGGKI
jgi:hypothetical protein